MFLPDFARNAGAFLVVLGVLVFVHELGHYLAARWRGVHVETFSIGFGRALLSWTDRVGTVWKLAWIPLGGYVKLHGQERPEDVSEDVRASWQHGRTFHGKPVLSRAIVVAAGPIANFLLAAVLFAGLFVTAGRPVSVPVIGEVMAESAASQAGLIAGDRVVSIDGTPVRRFEDLQRIVAGSPDKLLQVTVLRDGHEQTLPVQTASKEGALGRRMGVLGVKGGAAEFRQLDLLSAIGAGFEQTWEVTVQTVEGLGQMLSGSRNADELSGPLGIAQLSGQVASLGVASLISFIAVLSVNLGLINLFPIPILDGGHLVFYVFEALRGRPVPPRIQEYGFRAGFAVLAGLFVFATWNDLSHLGLFRWVRG
jgi:regulator of sigma E protease